MAIHFRLRELLEDRQMTQTELQARTGLAYSTINDMYHDKPRRVEFETLDALCIALDCEVGDILEHVADRHRPRATKAT